MRLIDRDVKRIVTLREQYSSLKVILMVNISLPSSQTTGDDLNPLPAFNDCPGGSIIPPMTESSQCDSFLQSSSSASTRIPVLH